MIRLNGACLVQLAHSLCRPFQEHQQAGAIVCQHDSLRRIQTFHAIVAAQRPFVFAIEPVNRRRDAMHGSFIGRLLAQKLAPDSDAIAFNFRIGLGKKTDCEGCGAK